MRVFIIAVGAVCAVACSKSDVPPPPPAANVAPVSAAAATPAEQGCLATGQWAKCSVMYRLDRAGLGPHIDSATTPGEKELAGTPLMLKIGQFAVLELHFYADSTARIADEKKLNRADFVDATADQTMKRERTLIESANVLGLLTSLNAHQRERVSDAITAGPPQPAQPVRIANPSKP